MAALRQHVADKGIPNQINNYLHASLRISEAMPQAISIDNFIDAHAGNEQIEICGKLAIVRSILEAEQRSTLFYHNLDGQTGVNFKGIQNTWFNGFFQLLTNNCRQDKLTTRLENNSFIIFNYDRCVEHFLFWSLQNYYGISDEEAAELLRALKIYHPYGQVGHLPWQGAQGSTPFGNNVGGGDLLARASQIKTFTEQIEDHTVINDTRNTLREADIIIFLGFAFHQLNMDLIFPDKLKGPRKIFATAKGISDSNSGVIRNELHTLSPAGGIFLRNEITCEGLFTEFSRSFVMK